MWASMVRLAFGLTFAAQMVSSRTIFSRQEQCASATSDAEQGACDMKAAFGGSSIIPQLLPDFSPKAALSVRYGNVVIGGAQQMSPSKVATQPLLSLSFISSNSQVFKQAYIVLGIEYQPQSKALRAFWFQSSVKIDESTGVMTSSPDPVVKYRSPNPSQVSKSNEYIFLVFQDPGLEALFKQNPQLVTMISGAFDFQAFLATFKLSNLLVAGSFFKSTFDGLPINGQNPSVSAPPQDEQVPQQSQRVSQSPPVESRMADESMTAKPEVKTQSESRIPTQSLQAVSPASSVTPVQNASQKVIAPGQFSEINQTETGQDATSSLATNLASQKHLASLAVVVVFAVSIL